MRNAFLAGGATVCVWALQTQAQNLSGFNSELRFATGLEYDSNPDLEEDEDSQTVLRTNLDYFLRSTTPTENFSALLSTGLEFGNDDSDDEDNIINPLIRLIYGRDVGTSNIEGRVQYREVDISSSFAESIDPADPDSVIITDTTGTRESRVYQLRGGFGIGTPTEHRYSLRRSEVRYSDTSDPSLQDRDENRFTYGIAFRPTGPVATELNALYDDRDVDGTGDDRETTRFNVSNTLRLSPVLNMNTLVGYGRVETDEEGSETEDGVDFGLGVTYDRATSIVGLDYTSRIETNGRRDNLIGRYAVELPRAQVEFRLGATFDEDLDELDPLYGLDYVQEFPTGQLTVNLSQEVVTNDLNDDEIVSLLNVAFTRNINTFSRLRGRIRVIDRNEVAGDNDDDQRLDASLTYNYALTRDWDLVTGVTYILRTFENDDDVDANRIFVGLERTFEWN